MLDWLQKVIRSPKRGPQADLRPRSIRTEAAPRVHVRAILPPVRHHELPPTFWQKSLPYKKGERIGSRFNIYEIMGRGGFGMAYLVFDSELHTLCALKTFRDELLADGRARAALIEEATRWVDLGDHPNILSADSVLEIYRRLYVRMEYIVPDDEGRTNLAHYLWGRKSREIPCARQLEWGVQFCLGMEHANSRGILSHRDIKPENIMIKADGTLKITDFGMAAVLEKSSKARHGAIPTANGSGHHHAALSVAEVKGRTVCGTPGYLAPELYRGESADVRSDIYSFGVVLWQMAAHRPAPPFCPESEERDAGILFQTAYGKQMGDLPPVDGPLQPIIAKCLKRERTERYESFEGLRRDLERLLWQESGRAAEVPLEPAPADLSSAGLSGGKVGRNPESAMGFDTAVYQIGQLGGKSAAFSQLGRHAECIQRCDEALLADPANVTALCNKGVALRALKRTNEALACFEACLKLVPEHPSAWYHKSLCLSDQGRDAAALEACSRAVQLESRHARSWELQGTLLLKQERCERAVACFDEALKHDPHSAAALFNKARALAKLRHPTDALVCFEVVLADRPDSSAAWLEKGRMLMLLKKYPRAIECFDKALAVVPILAAAWFNKGLAEEKLMNYKSAISCFTKFLELAGPEHQRTVPAIRAHLEALRGGVR